jgi:gas vesicle protein
MQMSNHRAIHIAEGVVIGATLGMATGILFAPKSGKYLRHDLARDAHKNWKKVRHFYFDTQARVDRILDDAKKGAEALRREADRQLREAQAQAKELLG